MNPFKEALRFIMSLFARALFNALQPIELVSQDCNSNFTTKVNFEDKVIIVSVNRWLQETKTKNGLFDTKSTYYIAEVIVINSGNVIINRCFNYPEPTRGYLNITKLPHSIIAQAVIKRIIGEVEEVVKTA